MAKTVIFLIFLSFLCASVLCAKRTRGSFIGQLKNVTQDELVYIRVEALASNWTRLVDFKYVPDTGRIYGKFHLYPGEIALKFLVKTTTFGEETHEVRLDTFGNDFETARLSAARFECTVKMRKPKEAGIHDLEPNSCGCTVGICSCCRQFTMPQFHHRVCANMSYNKPRLALDLSLGFDQYSYTYEISARNPPPVCAEIPGTREILSACLKFENLNVTRYLVSGCVEFEAELIHMRMVREKIGCFNIPI
ncbi:unnamed protein product, partial [Mesorhabditis spiculigera]